MHIANRHLDGEPPEDIAAAYQATTAQVCAALAYYYENKAAIDADIAENIRFGDLWESEGLDAALASLAPREGPAAAIIESLALISRDTDLHYSSPCIDGTQLRVADIVMEWRHGVADPALIADKYDLSLGQVFGALAYYYERKPEIDAEIEYESRFDARWKAEGLVPT